MSTESLHKYTALFANLHRNVNAIRGGAPHKPVLLLTLLGEIGRGAIRENLVRLTPELVAAFRVNWRALVTQGAWQDRIVLPYRHLIHEGFWELVKRGEPVTPAELGDTVSIMQLELRIDGGRFTPELWLLLQDSTARTALRRVLLDAYFPASEQTILATDQRSALDIEAERLMDSAGSPFRLRKTQAEVDADGLDGAYVRRAIFPRVIKNLYRATCAVCGIDVRNGQSDTLLIDAAHVVPFKISHNDDPRNGLALCRNHHAGFDEGWFSVSENYRVLVSPKLRQSIVYVRPGDPLRLPENTRYAPAPEALAWHRNHNRLD